MLNVFKNKKNLLIITLAVILLIVVIFIFNIFRKTDTKNVSNNTLSNFKGLIIDDTIKIPNTQDLSPNAGQIISRGEYDVKLQPVSEQEQVYITKAKLTLKNSYTVARVAADVWAPDQKLVYIKSNGALGLDGMSSSWQLVFTSAQKKKTYEIIIGEDKIVSQKEINANLNGFDLPLEWYDSYEAIASLSNLPQFKEGRLSAISFYYNEAAGSWAYGLAIDEKTTSMWVK